MSAMNLKVKPFLEGVELPNMKQLTHWTVKCEKILTI